VHPGGILATNLFRHEQIAEYREQERREADARDRGERTRFKTMQPGGATSVLVATWPGLDGIGGRYFEDCNEAEPLPDGFDPHSDVTGIAPYAVNPKNAERLWEAVGQSDRLNGTDAPARARLAPDAQFLDARDPPDTLYAKYPQIRAFRRFVKWS
jgi:hypothetical protein